MKKVYAILLGTLVIASIGIPITLTSIRDYKSREIEINLWYTYEGADEVYELVLEYESTHPNIDIIFTEQPSSGWLDKYISVAQTGEAPDIFLAKGSWLGELAELGYIKALTDFISPTFEAQYHIKGIEGLTYQNQLWAIPLWFDSFLLFYNPLLFDEKNLEYPLSNWTDLSLIELMNELTDSSENTYGAAWSTLSPFLWPAFQYGFGHGLLYQDNRIVVNDSSSVKAMEFLFNLKHSYKTIGYDDTSSSATQAFINNQTAMLIYGGWLIPTLKDMGFEYGLQILPIVNATGERFSPIVEVKGWGMSKDTRHPDTCFDIISFLSDYDAQELLLENEYKIPTLNQLLTSPVVTENSDILTQIAQIENSQYNPMDPLYNTYSDYMRAALQFILLQFQDIQSALNNAQEGIDSHSEG